MRTILLISLMFTATTTTAAEYFRVTLLRAAPGELKQLIDETKQLRTARNSDLLIMRHSQGDHWDLMLLEPAGDEQMVSRNFQTLLAFQQEFLAKSQWSWQEVKKGAVDAGMYHIEMFHAAPGKAAELLKQRQMENLYYNATERAGNVIFETVFGSDVDNFTLGFYKDLKTFATDPALPDSVFEKAATDAGFTKRADIGFYLRSLILKHHDTLATRVD